MTAPVSGLYPYLRVFQQRPDGSLWSPGVPDPPFIPTDPDPTDFSVITKASLVSNYQIDPPPVDTFVLRQTVPALADPLVPTGSDNVGWTGDVSGGVFTSLHTVPANTTRKGCVFLHDVILTDATSKLDDCIVFGGPATASRLGLVIAGAGGQLNRVTIWGLATSVQYYRNGIRHTGGVLTVNRCAIYRVVDAIHTSSSQPVYVYGNLADRFSFFDNDADHASGTPSLWTHNDFVQRTAGAGGLDEIIGNLIMARCDTTGVTWSGGSPGSGTASNGTIPTSHPTTRPTVATPIGMPATQLNDGYRNSFIEGNYCNGIMYSNASGFAPTIEDNWLEGGNNPSALIHFTTGTTNAPIIKRNKFGIAGYRTSTIRYLISYPTGTAAVIGTGADANIFGNFPSTIAAGIDGDPITITSGGGRYTA